MEQPPSKDVPPAARLHIWQIQAFRDVLFVGAVIALVWAGYALRAVTVPLLVALMLAYLFDPVIERTCRNTKVTRAGAVSILLALGIVSVLILIAVVVPLVAREASDFRREIRDGTVREQAEKILQRIPEAYRSDYESLIRHLPARVNWEDEEDSPSGPNDSTEGGPGKASPDEPPPPASMTTGELKAYIDAQVDSAVSERLASAAGVSVQEPDDSGQSIMRFAGKGLDAVLRLLTSVLQIGLLSFLIPFYFFFFSLWYPEVVDFGRKLIPVKKRERALELLTKMDGVVAGFVRGRIVISLMMGVLLAIGWKICGVPHSIALGLAIGIFCAVPYLGGIGIPLAVGLLFFDRFGDVGNEGIWWVWVIVGPTAVFLIVQLIEGYLLVPMIAGKATNLDPVTILVAVLAGGSVLGIYGMLLAIPLAACAKILFQESLMPRIRAWTRGDAADPLPIDES